MTNPDNRAALKSLQTLPNVGPSIAEDLILLGFQSPGELKGQDPDRLYQRLCEATKTRQDPCVLDTLRAVVHFADTGEAKKWWEFTPMRKPKR